MQATHCAVTGCTSTTTLTRGYCRGHYERLRKFGDVQADKPLTGQGAPRVKSHGYIAVYAKGHPLTASSGMGNYVYAHRMVLFDAVNGADQPCYRCGIALAWGIDLHVDHLDGDKTNNALANLAAVCSRCNVKRLPVLGRTERCSEIREWARARGLPVGIRGRLSQAVLDAWKAENGELEERAS